MVVCMEGWIDAGLGAAAAASALLGSTPTDLLATFDGDALIDNRARRPVVHIVDGVNTGLTWPQIELRVGQDRTGHDLLVLVGPEPDMKWHAFTADVVDLASLAGIEVDTRELEAAAGATHARVEQFIENNPEHIAMVRGLEAQVDAEEPAAFDQSTLPSGDEIAAELERFLRGEGTGL